MTPQPAPKAPAPIQLGAMRLDPPVFLAPMAGITDLPFRRAVVRHGGAGLLVSEMLASTEMITPSPSSRAASRVRALNEAGDAVSVQIAGREAGPMAETARIVEDLGARAIDINMGCPARKVTGGLSGAALMRDLDHALTLIEAVIGAVSVPVTLKMRLGWDEDSINAPDLAQRAADCGVQMLTVHGRTRVQLYKGRADWDRIRPVRDRVPAIPLVANGDICSADDARRAFAATGAQAVMVGRGAQGAPWRLAEIAHGLGLGPAPIIPQGAALIDAVSTHYEDMLGFYGAELGLRVARKHLGWWAEANHAPSDARRLLMQAATPAETLQTIRQVFADAAGAELQASQLQPA